MKKLLLTVLVLFPLLTQAAAPLGSGWTSTTNPATARTALGAVSTNQFQTNLTAQAGTNTALQTQITARIPSSSGSGTNILLVAPTVKAAGGLILDVRDSANEQVATWENDGNISLSNLPSDPSHVITKGYADALAFGSGDSTNGVNTVLTNFISVQAQTNALKLTALRGPGTSNIFDVPTMTNPVVAVSTGVSRLFFGDSFDIISDGNQISFNRLDGPNEIFSYNNPNDTFFIQEKLAVGEEVYISAGQGPLALHVEGGLSWFSNNVVNIGRAASYTTIDTNGGITATTISGNGSGLTNISISGVAGLTTATNDFLSKSAGGTVSAPLSIVAPTNAAMFTVSTNALVVTTNKYVGIGMNNPAYSLDVNGSVHAAGEFRGEMASRYAFLAINGGLYMQGDVDNYFAGDVGIGTTVPNKRLEINSATGANLRLTYNDSDGSAANYADFSISSSGDLTIAPSGGDIYIPNAVASGSPTTLGQLIATNALSLKIPTNSPTDGDIIVATGSNTKFTPNIGGSGGINTNNWAAWSSAESTNLPPQNAVLRIVGGGQTYILPSNTNAHGLVYLVYFLNDDEEDTVTFQTYSGGDYINETTDDTLEVPGDFQGIYLIYGNTNYFGSVGVDVSWTIWPLGGDAATWTTTRNAGGNSLTNLASIAVDGDGAGGIFLADDDNDAGIKLSAPAVVDASYGIRLPTNVASGFLYADIVGTNIFLRWTGDTNAPLRLKHNGNSVEAINLSDDTILSWDESGSLSIGAGAMINLDGADGTIESMGGFSFDGVAGDLSLTQGKLTVAETITIGAGGVKWISGEDTPEGNVTAPVGSIYSRTDGGAGTSMYVKESGSGNTGWIGK